MGAGIAEVLSRVSDHVTVFDANPDLAARVAARLPGVQAMPSLEEAITDADIVFEAIAENEEAKLDLYRRIGTIVPDAILASNTSSILPTALARATVSPERFVIAHFFNPATVVPLVEIVPAESTSAATVETVRSLLAAAGKEPVVLRRETPGFVANRLQAALLREAFALERDGVASFAEIDLVVRAGLGSRWAAAGPFAIVDLGGLDVWASVTARLFPELASDVSPPDALTTRVAEGRLGAKSGAGLYAHDPDTDAELRERIATHFDIEFSG